MMPIGKTGALPSSKYVAGTTCLPVAHDGHLFTLQFFFVDRYAGCILAFLLVNIVTRGEHQVCQ